MDKGQAEREVGEKGTAKKWRQGARMRGEKKQSRWERRRKIDKKPLSGTLREALYLFCINSTGS